MFGIREKPATAGMSGPTYMTDEQISAYLKDLRTNRVSRPAGSRPLPAKIPSIKPLEPLPKLWPTSPRLPPDAASPASPILTGRQSPWPPRHAHTRSDVASLSSSSAASSTLGPHGHTTSASSGSPTTATSPALPYQERAQRLQERREAREIREAMDRLKLETDAEEQRLFDAAQREAAELVLRHRSEGLPKPQPAAPYRNPDLRWRRLQRRRESAMNGAAEADRVAAERDAGTTKVSAHVSEVPASTTLADTAKPSQLGAETPDAQRYEVERARGEIRPLSFAKPRSVSKRVDTVTALPWLNRRRKSSGRAKRVGSGGGSVTKHLFGVSRASNAGGESRTSRVRFGPTMDAAQSRDGLDGRAGSGGEGAPSSGILRNKLNRFEVHRNPPTQSKNPQYTQNPAPEVAAPKEQEQSRQETMPAIEIRSDEIRAATSMRRKDRSPNLPLPTAVSDSSRRPIVSFQQEWEPPKKETSASSSQPALMITPSSSVPQVTVSPDSTVPSISISTDDTTPTTRSPSRGNNSNGPTSRETPTKSLPTRPLPQPGPPGVPSINVSGTGDVCSITVPSEAPPVNHSARPLPKPSSTTAPRTSKNADATPQWRTPYIRTGVPAAACDSCHQPIAGRVVTACNARFHPHCFTCFHCHTPLECVAFYQEPEHKRQTRLAAAAEPSDTMQRFYCHLDFHELFSPRCKSCKTPIEGEVVVACGAQYHVGHFFCAECGDPFGPTTPFVERDGHAWCVACHSRRTSPRCVGCKQLVMDEMIINALGGSWHSKCFKCCECEGEISHESGFFVREGPPKVSAKGRQVGGPVRLPVCERCEACRLKA